MNVSFVSGSTLNQSSTKAIAGSSNAPQIVGKYELGRVLASGDFDCRTRICTHVVTGAQYAVRIYDKRILAEAQWMWNQVREAVQVMRMLPKHENIVEMVECFETQSSLYILMQFYSPTSITKMYTAAAASSQSRTAAPGAAQSQPTATIPFSKTKYFFGQVVKGLLHMHDHGVVHCGIAPDHVLVSDRDLVKISFLVSCRYYQKGKLMTGMRGTSHTVAPEILREEPYDPVSADAWSLGVLLFFMLNNGQYPHDGANTSKNIVKNRMRPLDANVPPLARQLVESLLSPNPANRIPVADILSHPWMTEDKSAEEDADLMLMDRRSARMSIVESTYDPTADVLNITLPFGLSVEEEAAFIIQHTWRAYKKRRMGASRLRRGTSVRLKRAVSSTTTKGITSHAASILSASGSRRKSLVESVAERRISRSSSIVLESSHASSSAGGADGAVVRKPTPPPFGIRVSSPLTPPVASPLPGAAPHHNGQKHRVDFTNASIVHPSQCEHCGRMPPQRLIPGKAPYENIRAADSGASHWAADKQITTPTPAALALHQGHQVVALPPIGNSNAPAAPKPYPAAKFRLNSKGEFEEVRQ